MEISAINKEIDNNSIDIVIATYNGEKYISSQIKSITDMDFFDKYINKIIVCDDSSTDNTILIIQSIVSEDKLIILKNDTSTPFGPIKNFERGIKYSDSEYVMLSDQDDVWHKNKLNLYINKLVSVDREKPLLIFSDLSVVDHELNIISDSFLNYQSIPKDWFFDINNLLIQNVAPGCTMLFNKCLKAEALPFPEDCLMHDWWLILVCKLKGHVLFLQEPLVLYRQHTNNQVGAKNNGLLFSLMNYRQMCIKSDDNLKKTIIQMNSFYNKFEFKLPLGVIRKINTWNYCYLSKHKKINKIKMFFLDSLKKSCLYKNIGLLWLICISKSE